MASSLNVCRDRPTLKIVVKYNLNKLAELIFVEQIRATLDVACLIYKSTSSTRNSKQSSAAVLVQL